MTYLEQAEKVKNETKEAIELILGELNHGQRQKLLNNDSIKKLIDRYGVEA